MFRATGACKEAFAYHEKQLLAAATLGAAEFEASRSFSLSSVEEDAPKVLIATNSEIAGWWRGSRLGIISILREAATARGVTVGGNFAPHQGSGVYPAASPQRIIRALTDIFSSPSSLHSFAWNVGAWPVKMLGAQTAISSGWIMNYLISPANQLSLEREHHLGLPPSASSEGEAPEATRRCERPERGLPKLSK